MIGRNHLLPIFHSRFWNRYCEAMDSVKRSWDFDSNWVCPPPHLVPRALNIGVRAGGARGAAAPPNFGQLIFFGHAAREKLGKASFLTRFRVF